MKDRVLEAVDIVDVVGERVALTRKGKDLVGLCPFHPDHKPSLAVSPTKKIFKCWSCGAGGDVIKFVMLRERLDFLDALKLLARRAGIQESPSPRAEHDARLREQIRSVVAWSGELFCSNLRGDAGAAARDYVRARGVSAESIERHRLGFAPASWDWLVRAATGRVSAELLEHAGLVARHESGRVYDRFRNRLIFPIQDPLGRAIAFGGRTLADDPAKYLNSPETVLFNKSRVLFGFHLARPEIERRKEVVVVEGYMDAVLLHQHGFENAVATLGTALTDAHIKLLHPLADRLYLCFDGDAAGIRAADRAVETSLRTRADVRVVVLDPGVDPADCVVTGGAEAFERCLSRSVEALEFKWRQTSRAFGTSGPTARRAAVEEYLRFVAVVAAAGGIDPLEQGLLVARLGDLLSVPRELVFELLAGAKRARGRERHTAARPGGEDALLAHDAEASDGLPLGMGAALEELLGLLVSDSRCWTWATDALATAVEHSGTWRPLYQVCVELFRQRGEYSLADVVERCDDAALCHALDRVRRRVAGVVATRELFETAQERLRTEMDLMRMADLRGNLRGSDSSADEAFRTLAREVSQRDPDAVLPVERHWSAAATA